MPFVEWDGAVVRLDPVRLEAMVLQRLREVEILQWLHLEGEGDRLRVDVVLRLGRVPVHAAVEIAELRIAAGWIGCRLLRVELPGGIAVPFGLIRRVLARIGAVRTRILPGPRIVLADIRPFLPDGVAATLRDLRITGGALQVTLGPGLVRDLPPL